MGRKKIRRLSHFRGEKKDTVGIHAAKLLIRRLRINTQSPVGGRGKGTLGAGLEEKAAFLVDPRLLIWTGHGCLEVEGLPGAGEVTRDWEPRERS